MQIINTPDSQTEPFFKEFKFAPDMFVKDLRFHENFKRISYPEALVGGSSLSVQTNKPIGNNFNCFYFEAEELSNTYVCIGFTTQGFPSYKVPGKTRHGRQSFGLQYCNNLLSLSCKKLQLFEKHIEDVRTIGLGVNIISSKIFVTINGRLEAENALPKLQPLYPTICLKPGSDVRVRFTGFEFGLNEYMRESVKASLQSHKVDIKPDNTMFLVKSYLKENGYLDTLRALDPEAERETARVLSKSPGKKKRHSVSALAPSDQPALTIKEKHKIRHEVFKKNNWDYLLTLEDSLFFDQKLKANIVLISFLGKYFNAKDESQKLKIFQSYESRFIELKAQAVYNEDLTVESVINDFVLDENTSAYRHLAAPEQKNRVLGHLFGTHKNNKLSTVVKHLTLLLKKNAEFYSFEPGYDLNKLNN